MQRTARNLAIALAAITQIAFASLNSSSANLPQQKQARANELTLAGMRPGRDTIAAAEKKFPSGLLQEANDSSSAHVWLDRCSNRRLSVESDASGIVQNINIETVAPDSKPPCETGANVSVALAKFWKTGHGLHLGNLKQRVLEIYGKPGSSGPSVKNGRELELLYYAFDWAGPDVPQVMEISCDRASGRVVEIMLAFPSL